MYICIRFHKWSLGIDFGTKKKLYGFFGFREFFLNLEMANFVPASYSNLKMFQMEKVIKSLILFPKLKLYIYIYI